MPRPTPPARWTPPPITACSPTTSSTTKRRRPTGSAACARTNGLGLPPDSPANPAEKVQVFQPVDDGIPERYRSHPTDHMREKNAKRIYIRSPQDDRSPWLLFGSLAVLKREVSDGSTGTCSAGARPTSRGPRRKSRRSSTPNTPRPPMTPGTTACTTTA